MTRFEILRKYFFNRYDTSMTKRGPSKKDFFRVNHDEAQLDELIQGHLDGTGPRLGPYSTNPLDFKCRWACFDLDQHAKDDGSPTGLPNPREVAARYQVRLTDLGLRSYLEASGGGKGYHVWIFFAEPILAKIVRLLGLAFTEQREPTIEGGETKNEFFPKQDEPKDGFGNIVWLPWWGGAKEGGNQFFEDVSEGFELVSSGQLRAAITKLNEQGQLAAVVRPERSGFTPDERLESGMELMPLEMRQERFEAWLEAAGPAVQGASGDIHTWNQACVGVKDFLLEPDEAMWAMTDWNSSCDPPWDDRDLMLKLNNAAKGQRTGSKAYWYPKATTEELWAWEDFTRRLVNRGRECPEGLLEHLPLDPPPRAMSKTAEAMGRAMGQAISIAAEAAAYGLQVDGYVEGLMRTPAGKVHLALSQPGHVNTLLGLALPIAEDGALVDFEAAGSACRFSFDSRAGEVLLGGKVLPLEHAVVTCKQRAGLVELFQVEVSDKKGTSIKVPDFGKETFYDGLVHQAKLNTFDPVLDYLDGLPEWDGVDRVAGLYQALRVKEPFEAYPDLYEIFLRKTLIGAVRRARQPGCKLDTICVLQELVGGTGKSSFWKVLFGREFFSDQKLEDGKDGLELIGRFWAIEMAEMPNAKRKEEIDEFKAFVTRQIDTYRAPYERKSSSHQRASLFVGTSNDRHFIGDSGGERRFWIIPECGYGGAIDLNWVAANRDQLWAQACVLEAAGEQHWIQHGTDEWRALEAANQENREQDEIEGAVVRALEVLRSRVDFEGHFLLSDVAALVGLGGSQFGKGTRDRLGRVMKKIGLERKQVRVLGIKTWVWVWPEDDGQVVARGLTLDEVVSHPEN